MNFFSYSSQSPLLFTQLYFWIFLLIVLIIFAFIKNKLKLSHLYLALVSFFFYYKSSGTFVSLLLIVTVLDFFVGKGIFALKTRLKKKILLTLGVVINLAFLAYFKYTYFFIDILNTYFGSNIEKTNYLSLFVNNSFGTSFTIDKIILPVGISFYTFQAISYVVDVYRNRIKRQPTFCDFAFYLSFFPQLVAGPIVRADNFLPQLYKPYSLTKRDFNIAFFFILNGLIKKIFVSDFISINFVDRVFSLPSSYSGIENLLAAYGYTMQIYCDFSGYTDIAIAVSLLFGFHLPINFNSPYKAVNITDFWHRWHISLSTWLKDYLYISLGGNRKGKFRQYINLLTTMLLGGLWHGANLKFIFWGFLHGIGLVFDKIFNNAFPKLIKNKVWRVFSCIITFHFVAGLWVFFRADDFNSAIMMFERMFTYFHFEIIDKVFLAYWKPLTIIFFALIIHILPTKWKEGIRECFYSLHIVFKIMVALIVVFIHVQTKSSQIQPFIYFQF
jgi:D-alanyl-lipoteichoic acid acyltransferase DltB (MBOAT superfamily)